ncbi:hypothetical protein ASF91_13535 [Rhizobium sp. Leaf155]|nr:hypothetical protein ASF91_13535 [Rhizobium sp. Leaf155]
MAVLSPRMGGGVAAQIRISALPINSATVSLFSPDAKLAGRAEGTGTAPTFAAQQMAFSLPLTNVGVEVYDALTNSSTGVPVVVQYTYNGLTPPAGFKVKINYRNALEHYSKDEQFRARASYYGWVSASVSSQNTSIRDELISSGAIEVTMIDGTNFAPARLDAYLQPILKRINDQVLENSKPPPPVSPAAAQAPNADGYFGGAGYSVATKSVSQLKILTEEIDFRQQSIVERSTIASGFIGIGNYPADVRTGLKITVDGTSLPSAYVAFPSIPPAIQKVQLEVTLEARGTKFATRTYVHELNGSWIDLANGKIADRIGFSLAAVEQKFGKSALDEAQFLIRKTISTANDSITFTDRAPAREGAGAVSLQNRVAGFQLRGSQLTFRQMGGDLVRMELTAKSAETEKSYAFEAININGIWQTPPDEYFLMQEAAVGAPVTLTAKLVFADRSKNRTPPPQTVILQEGFVPVYLDNFLD